MFFPTLVSLHTRSPHTSHHNKVTGEGESVILCAPAKRSATNVSISLRGRRALIYEINNKVHEGKGKHGLNSNH